MECYKSSYNRVLAFCFALAILHVFFNDAHKASAQDLHVYSYFEEAWGPGEALEKGFEKQCSCDLKWVSFSDAGGLLARLKLEKEKTKADVVLGLDQNLLPDALALDIWQEHNVESDFLSLPFQLEEKQFFLPYDFGWFSFVYDKTIVTDPPKSLDALAESDYTILIQDPRSSSPGMGFLTWVESVYGKDSKAFWKALKARIIAVTPGWSEAYTLFLEQEADLVLSYTTSPAYHRIAEQEDRYDWARFAEGHYPQIEIMAITKQARDTALARAFLSYVLSVEGQSIISQTNWMYPVRQLGLPDGFSVKPLPASRALIPFARLAKERATWIKEWRMIMEQ